MTSTPVTLSNIVAAELVGLAKQIRAWQEQRNLSDNEILRRMPGLGSTKTYARLLKDDTAELDLDRWLDNYRAVWAVIESIAGREREAESLFDDISTVVAMRRSIVDVLEARTIRRVILLEAESGLGKSSALTILQRKYGMRILPMEAADAWGDNPMALLSVILDAVGVREHAMTRDGRLRQVVNKLRDHRVMLGIDEAHHLGPHCLNTCKTLINQTPAEISLLALPTLWRRLERSNYEEVKQLLGNRLSERIKIGDIREADVRKILHRRAKVEDTKSAGLVLEAARTRGNLAFVSAVCERIAEQEIDGTPSHENVAAAVAAEKARR